MKKTIVFFLLAMCLLPVKAEDTDLPVLGLCISAPEHEYVNEFDKFIREELAPLGINTLVLRVDWGYEFETHPELRSDNPLTEKDVKTLVRTCKDLNINLIPQIDLLGHQSWETECGKLPVSY